MQCYAMLRDAMQCIVHNTMHDATLWTAQNTFCRVQVVGRSVTDSASATHTHTHTWPVVGVGQHAQAFLAV